MSVYVSTSIPTMEWSSTDMAESLGLFKRKMNLFLDDENITDNAAKARKICWGIRDEGLRRINASDLSPEQKQNPLELWTLFDNQINVNVNFRIHRLHLMKYRQTRDESIDDFVTRARTLANQCQFTENELNERLMELIIASTPYDGLRRELLGKPIGHTIRDVLKEGRKLEALSAENDQLQQSTQSSQTSTLFRTFASVEIVVRATDHVNALRTKTNAVRAMRLVTGRLAAGKLERNNAQAAVENVTIELPAIDMAIRDAAVHQALTERIAGYIQSTPITRRMASRINNRSMPSPSARNVSMRSTYIAGFRSGAALFSGLLCITSNG